MQDQESYSGKIDRKTLHNMLIDLEQLGLIKMVYRKMNGINVTCFNMNTLGNNIILWKGVPENDERVLQLENIGFAETKKKEDVQYQMVLRKKIKLEDDVV